LDSGAHGEFLFKEQNRRSFIRQKSKPRLEAARLEKTMNKSPAFHEAAFELHEAAIKFVAFVNQLEIILSEIFRSADSRCRDFWRRISL
jgi:hypothetical protein